MRIRSLYHYGRLEKFSALYLFVGFIVLFGLWAPTTFLTMASVHSIASQQAVAGIIAIAILVPMTCGNFDLSVGANANLAGILAIVMQVNHHWSAVASIALAIGVGVVVGWLNGLLVVKFHINSFIATLGMGSILAATEIIVTGGLQPAAPTSTAWYNLTQAQFGGFQVVFFYLIAVALIAWWALDFTPPGRYLYAVGGNSEAARLSGVRVGRVTWGSLIVAGGVAGLGGVLYTSLTGPSLTFGSTLLLPAFAAPFLGSTQLQPGRFNVWGTIIAIYVLATGVQGLQLVSGQQWLSDMFNGVALIIAVGLSVARQNRPIRERTTPEEMERELKELTKEQMAGSAVS